MSQGASTSRKDQATNSSSRRKVQRTSVSRVRGNVTPMAEMRQATATSAGLHQFVEEDMVQALMDLALPRFDKSNDRATPKGRPWPVSLSSPASPASVDGRNRTRSPSPCVDLDVLSSDDSEVDVTPQDYNITLFCDSDDSRTPVGSVQFFSKEDPPLRPRQGDRRKVLKRNNPPLCQSESLDRPANEPARIEPSVDIEEDSLINKQLVDELQEWSDSELEPLIDLKDTSVVEMVDMAGCSLPKFSEIMSPRSPATIAFDDQGDSSAPLSPNLVQVGRSQDMPVEGSIFDVSPDLPGFDMWPAGAVLKLPEITQTTPSAYGGFTDPFFGAPIAFAQCNKIPGLDTPMTLPVYTMPKEANIFPDQSAVPTVLASGVSPDSVPWSTAEDLMNDISREGPFDAGTSPMDTEDSPLITTGLPGCPYRIKSYTGTALLDANTTYGLQLHHPRFLEFIGAPESARLLNHSPSFWVDHLGEECAMAAAVNLQRDAGLMMSNLQILAQFVTALHRMSSEMMCIGIGQVVCPTEDVADLSMTPRAQRAAKYMTAMGIWRPPSGPGAPGPVPTSTCASCMRCEYCFPGRRPPPK